MLTLNYLPLQARAEHLRMLLHYTELDFQNNVVSLSDWPDCKEERAICPLGQLPSLQLASGTVLVQSGAIARYIARVGNILPDGPEKMAINDMVYELAQEMNMINPLYNYFPYDSEKWKTEYKTYFTALPLRLEFISKTLGNLPYFGGDDNTSSPSYADFGLYHTLYLVRELDDAHMLDNHPTIIAWMDRIYNIPSIKHYIDNRPPIGDFGIPGCYVLTVCNKQSK